MKKTLFVVLAVAMLALLGLAVFAVQDFYSSSAFPPCCPFFTGQTETGRFEPGSSRGFGMMGPGMMGAMHVSIENELDFLTHMIPHHQEAVDTAVYLRDNTDRPEMRAFANDIIATQSAEIELMTTWLETWYPDDQHVVDYRPMMRNLEGLKGDALDRVFLEDMIPHHMTAVMMAQQLLSGGLAEHEEVAILAGNIRNNQRAEIHMMMRWLAAGEVEAPFTTGQPMPVWLAGLIMLLFLVFIVLAALLAVLLLSTNRRQEFAAHETREILDRRYAKGEISREEYLDLR